MKLAFLAAIFAMTTSASILNSTVPIDHKPSRDARDLYHCKLKSVHAADNDIRLGEDVRSKPSPAILPGIVAQRILYQVTSDAKRHFTQEEWRESKQSCATVFGSVFYLSGPERLRLYVGPRYFIISNEVDYFVMYDPRTGAVTKAPPLIYTKWSPAFEKSNRLIKAPIVRMKPARGSQPPLLIVEERAHNGNVYDAVIYRYFEVGRDMSLTQILAVEARAILMWDEDEYTERKATFLTSNRVRLDISSRSSWKLGARGSVLLERAHTGQPFHVVRRMPARGGSTEGLVTYCDTAKSDDDFLRVGCDFYY